MGTKVDLGAPAEDWAACPCVPSPEMGGSKGFVLVIGSGIRSPLKSH